MTPKIQRDSSEIKVYGVNACQALWQNRASDIIRVYVTKQRLQEFGPLLRWCAQQKKAYHVVEPAELERVAASVHHEGVVILARELGRLEAGELERRLASLAGPLPLLYLDGVKNPHNVGSILRVAAHFGSPFVLGRQGELPRLSSAAMRVAEGGTEHVRLVGLDDPDTVLTRLKKSGLPLVCASGHGTTSLYEGQLPARCVLAVGNEVTGLSSRVQAAADLVVRIPGTGSVESINVAMAAGLLLGEHWRQHRSRV